MGIEIQIVPGVQGKKKKIRESRDEEKGTKRTTKNEKIGDAIREQREQNKKKTDSEQIPVSGCHHIEERKRRKQHV